MLDTVIKIGKLYREAPNAHEFHEQIKPAIKDVEALQKKKDKDGNKIETVFYELPVIDKGDRFLFDFENMKEITDEDKQKSLYYLNFKTSSNDSTKRYLFGDIFYSPISVVNYKIGQTVEKGSFMKLQKIKDDFKDAKTIMKFRYEFQQNLEKIENFLKDFNGIFLHFNFNGKSWFQLQGIIDELNKILLKQFFDLEKKTNKYVHKKKLYKTLIGGEFPYYGSIPNFNRNKNSYKGSAFSEEDVFNLFYAKSAYNKSVIRLQDKLSINVLPDAKGVTYSELEEFYSERLTLNKLKSKENIINENNNIYEADDLFDVVVNNSLKDKTKFDIIFMLFNSSSKSFDDLLELSNIEKSQLIRINDKIITEKRKIEKSQQSIDLSLNVNKSFFKILQGVKSDKSKLQMHLLKVLPQIYTDTYYQDPVLLPAFIEKVEKNIRDGGQSFTTLKYDFYFLTNIQKNNNMNKITNTKSYTLGYNLGIMARQFAAWRTDCPIKSFEKSYVGNLSRRISSIKDLTKFSNFINEKLVIHNRLYPEVKDAYRNLVSTIKDFEDEKYNKHNCALGFFESYYGAGKINEENN